MFEIFSYFQIVFYLHCGPLSSIGKWSGDRKVSVNRYHHQVPDTGITGQVVYGQPGVAQVAGEWPLLHDQHHGEQGHGEGPDDQVCHGQRKEEVVGDGL